MRTTGVSGSLVRLAAVMVPMFGLLVLAQAPPPPAAAGRRAARADRSAPAGSRRARRRRRRHAVVDDQRGRGLLAQASDHRAHAAGAGEDVHPAARLPHGARRRGARRHQPRGDQVRRQRPHVRRRVHHLHARRGRQQSAHAREPHHALREHQGRRRLRQADGLRRQAGAAAHDRSARRQQHPDQRDGVGRRRQVHRYQQRRRRRQARALLLGHRHRPRRQPRARAGRLQLGPRQLDLHDLQRLPHPLDAERHPQGADRAERRAVGRDDGR